MKKIGNRHLTAHGAVGVNPDEMKALQIVTSVQKVHNLKMPPEGEMKPQTHSLGFERAQPILIASHEGQFSSERLS